MRLLKESLKILSEVDEFNLSYLYGNHTSTLNYLVKNEKSKFLFRILNYIYFIARRLKLKKNNNIRCDTLIYAGTTNQLNSVIGVYRELIKLERKPFLLVEPNLIKLCKDYNVNFGVVGFPTKVTMNSLGLNLVRSRYILGKKSNITGFWNCFDFFLKSHFYLNYFEELLSNGCIDNILTSNDHNVSNRAFLMVAKKHSIKTMYVQHASVSTYFPELEFDYAFLDGYHSLMIYESISNRKSTHKTTVFLTGQKKLLPRIQNKPNILSVGLALNNLDNIHLVKKIIDDCISKNIFVRVRLHPSQFYNYRRFIERIYGGSALVCITNPSTESIHDFFSSVSFVIASNTGIHLEAALLGIFSCYFNLSNSCDYNDYYGFVKNGLCPSVGSVSEALILFKSKNMNGDEKKLAIRNYSSTFSTSWQGYESELLAILVVMVSCDDYDASKIMNYIDLYSYPTYDLKER
ncbi:hypothetical protein LRP49_14860 [Enterovibrio sp. ZSDZ35]|uniref:Capsule polysaccharide biosynthesis protein n=1 Tax=Enterovibrio qingdaonensis TaxID=2899818 RepID=A0ABT5QN88_9GAMM|nr:hypothetical protein [Enterovibrio sp. ZSDZ35]MDD1782450.1 hypothetical protein [Enterovibrio sp. ZSDZ35]